MKTNLWIIIYLLAVSCRPINAPRALPGEEKSSIVEAEPEDNTQTQTPTDSTSNTIPTTQPTVPAEPLKPVQPTLPTLPVTDPILPTAPQEPPKTFTVTFTAPSTFTGGNVIGIRGTNISCNFATSTTCSQSYPAGSKLTFTLNSQTITVAGKTYAYANQQQCNGIMQNNPSREMQITLDQNYTCGWKYIPQ